MKSWELRVNTLLYFLIMFNFKVALLSKGFTVDAISQEKREKMENWDTLL